jgi:alcohol dehydrogenase (cytochrome c)
VVTLARSSPVDGATLAAVSLAAQGPDPGRQVFVSRCASCHGTDGNGGEPGPNIASRIPSRTDQDLSTVIRQGLTTAGMPAFPNLSDTEGTDLIRFLRTLRPRAGNGPARMKVTLPGGRALDGLALNQSSVDVQRYPSSSFAFWSHSAMNRKTFSRGG